MAKSTKKCTLQGEQKQAFVRTLSLDVFNWGTSIDRMKTHLMFCKTVKIILLNGFEMLN